MAEVLEAAGKSVEEALESALSRMGKTAGQVDYEILEQPSRGFFGLFGAKPARIRVTAKAQPVQRESCPAMPADDPGSIDRSKGSALPEEQAARAEKFLRDVFAAMKLEVKIERSSSEEGILFQLIGENLGILIGKHGQTLDSLQYLANLTANRGLAENRVRVILDIENYRARREDTLMRLADHLAEKACRIGEEVHLEPMNRHERKIIHTALQADRRVSTYSAGDEPRRYVVIAPKRRRRRFDRSDRFQEE